jgi:hypothetical protein
MSQGVIASASEKRTPGKSRMTLFAARFVLVAPGSGIKKTGEAVWFYWPG